MKCIPFLLSTILILAAISCSKENQDPVDNSGLSGTQWRPVHASGSMDREGVYSYWDGDLDENNQLIVHTVVNGVESEYYLTFTCVSFIRDCGLNLYCRYYEWEEPTTLPYYLRYKVERDDLLLETQSHNHNEAKGSGEYETFKIEELTPSSLKFEGITYERIR